MSDLEEFGDFRMATIEMQLKVGVVISDFFGHYVKLRLEKPEIGAVPFSVDPAMEQFLLSRSHYELRLMITGLVERLYDKTSDVELVLVATEHNCG